MHVNDMWYSNKCCFERKKKPKQSWGIEICFPLMFKMRHEESLLPDYYLLFLSAKIHNFNGLCVRLNGTNKNELHEIQLKNSSLRNMQLSNTFLRYTHFMTWICFRVWNNCSNWNEIPWSEMNFFRLRIISEKKW